MEEIPDSAYFLYSIEKDKNWEIISENPLNIVGTFNKINDKNISFNINLYEIKTDKIKYNKNEKRIKIKLINRNNNKYSYDYSFDIYPLYSSIYLYDIEFRNQNKFPLPPQYNLIFDEKYEIFSGKKEDINYGKYLFDERKLAILIKYTQDKLKKEKYYNFSLFVLIFNDIIKFNLSGFLFNEHIQVFDINKIIFDDKKIYHHLDIRSLFSFLDTKKFEDDKLNQNLKLFYDLLLIWLYKQSKDLIESNFYEKLINKRIVKILSNKIRPDYAKLLGDLKLSFNVINGFIKITDNYRDILIILSYNDNFLESLEIINENFEFIKKNS